MLVAYDRAAEVAAVDEPVPQQPPQDSVDVRGRQLISARLGHSTITITLDRYGHLFPSVEEALAEALDAAFAAPAEATNIRQIAR